MSESLFTFLVLTMLVLLIFGLLTIIIELYLDYKTKSNHKRIMDKVIRKL
jgi:hypothetical protein